MEEPQLHFRINSIHVLEFSQREPDQPIVLGENHEMHIGMRVQTDKAQNLIRIILEVTEATSPALFKIKTAMSFQFKEGELFDADAEVVISEFVLNMLASITYSTTRGVLFAKMGFSPLVSLIMPLIDIREITRQIKPIGQVESNDAND